MLRSKLYELTLNLLSEINQIIIVGDIHGDYKSFRRVSNLFDPNQDFLIFLGDYADRGPKGIEVIDGVKELVRKYPGKVVALKGNHEDYTKEGKPTFKPCDLIYEANEKKGSWATYFKNELIPFTNMLYLAALVPGEVLFVHGGISRRVQRLDDLRYPSRCVEIDVLWSDPFEGWGEYQNTRGAGVMFGKDISKEICQKLGLKRVVRSHQPRKARKEPYMEHDGRIITISSTLIYKGRSFALSLPVKNLDTAFRNLEKHTVSF